VYKVFDVIDADSTVPLTLGLNYYTGYMAPVNLNVLHLPYLYFGFLPITHAQNNNVQGIKVRCVTTHVVATSGSNRLTLFSRQLFQSKYTVALHPSICVSVTSRCALETDEGIKVVFF